MNLEYLKGKIKAVGAKAITIEMDNKKQFYAPMEYLDIYVKEQLIYPLPYLPVKFHPIWSMKQGDTIHGPRCFATNVKLDLEF